MHNSRSIIGIFIVGLVFLFAIWLGVSIVTDQLETLGYVIAGSTLIICAVLGNRIWMIIPFAMALNVTLRIPGTPTTLLLAQALFCGFFTLLFLLRRVPINFKISELEVWTLLLSLCVLQAYLRNPVGLNILGSNSVGARPYAIFGLTLITSLIMSQLRIPASDLKWLLRLHIIGGLFNFALLSVGYFIPRIGVWYGAVITTGDSQGVMQRGQYGVERAGRIPFLATIGRNVSLWVGSFRSPIKACFHPLWAPLILLSLGFAGFSGYRSEIAAVGLTYMIAIAYRGGFHSFIFASIAFIMGLALLAAINLAAPLPANIQRALSFLPGTWEQTHIADAELSTQWRVDMWKEALLTNYWIQNKSLGDGLGMSRRELDYIQSFDAYRIGGGGVVGTGKLTKQQEFMMASNNYHSGPVSTIRTIGYVGLVILIIAQIRLSVHAHRQIRRARNTEWYPLCLLVGIPLIWAPFYFVFIYGIFDTATASFLLGVAILRMLEKNLPIATHANSSPPVMDKKAPAYQTI